MKRLAPLALLSLVAMFVLLQSCKEATETKKTVTITDASFWIDNTPNDWWSAGAQTKPSLIYNFRIYFSGDIAAADIEHAYVYLPNNNSHWTLDVESGFNAASQKITDSGFWYSTNVRELPIGTLTAEIKLTSGAVSKFPFTMGIPGSISPGDKNYVYCQEDESLASFPSVSVPAVSRPTVTGISNIGSSISVSFTCNGSNVNNGYIWFFDGNRDYKGFFGYFRDGTSGADSGKLTGGFHRSDGGSNTITLAATDIVDSNGDAITSTAFASISHCRVIVTDGSQYIATNGYANYDYRAISSMY
jgi:hypothetical protein